MYIYHSKAIKGCSIANIVLSSLGIFVIILAFFGMGIAGSGLSGSGDTVVADGYVYSTNEIASMLIQAGVMLSLAFVCLVILLIAGIFSVANSADPSKMSKVMVWNVVGAIAGFIGAGLVGGVLCVIVAVFANMDKKAFASIDPMTQVFQTESTYVQQQGVPYEAQATGEADDAMSAERIPADRLYEAQPAQQGQAVPYEGSQPMETIQSSDAQPVSVAQPYEGQPQPEQVVQPYEGQSQASQAAWPYEDQSQSARTDRPGPAQASEGFQPYEPPQPTEPQPAGHPIDGNPYANYGGDEKLF